MARMSFSHGICATCRTHSSGDKRFGAAASLGAVVGAAGLALYFRRDTQAERARMSTEGVRGSLTNAQGLRLETVAWEVSNAVGAVVCLHGYGSFSGWEFLAHPGLGYAGSSVEALNTAGYSVFAYDMQSFGASDGVHPGRRAHVNAFSDFVDDAAQVGSCRMISSGLCSSSRVRYGWSVLMQVYNGAKAKMGARPVFVLGESMGGCVAAMLAMRLGEALAGVD